MLDNQTRDTLTSRFYAEFYKTNERLFKENLREYCSQAHRYVLKKIEEETVKIEKNKK